MRRYLKSFSLIFIAVIIAVGVLTVNQKALALIPGDNIVISKNSSGLVTGGGDSYISNDGRVVAFHSTQPVLPNGSGVLYVRDLSTGIINRIDVSSGGVSANQLANSVRHISATGRYVVFQSKATNLIDGVSLPLGIERLYLRDVKTSETTLVAESIAGVVGNGSYETSLGVSSDGRFVAFATNASNLHPDSTDGTNHLYMLDRVEDTLAILDRWANGNLGFTNWNFVGNMSCDGSMIAFQYGGNVDYNEYNSKVSVYLIDRRGTTDKITNLTKSAANSTHAPSISCNGDYIGFSTESNNLDPTVTVPHDGKYRPYVYDRINGTYHLASISTSNTVSASDVCIKPFMTTWNVPPCVVVSDDGVAAFTANDQSLTGVTNGLGQVYIRNIRNSTTELVSRNVAGVPGDYTSSGPRISADGSKVVYNSRSTNLLEGSVLSSSSNRVYLSQTSY